MLDLHPIQVAYIEWLDDNEQWEELERYMNLVQLATPPYLPLDYTSLHT